MSKFTIPIDVMQSRSEALVISLVGKAMAPKWWESQNKAFNLETPTEHFKKHPEVVYNYLMRHAI